MNKITNNLSFTYFVIHALVELICFSLLYNGLGPGITFIIAFTFDFFAFVPQAIFGELSNHFPKLDIGSIGVLLMGISIFFLNQQELSLYICGVLILGLGNALLHEAGAIATVIVSNGRLFPSALFVSGGSFGLIIGQTIGKAGLNTYWLLLPLLIIEIMVLYSNKHWLLAERKMPVFQITKENKSEQLIILVAFLVTVIRSHIGYAIPISWNKTLWQAFLLFFIMGLGKAMGGYWSDKYGARKVGVFSTLFCIPFLIIGKNTMLLSIIGVFLFSLTMSICFGMLLSVIKDNPGVAFGITTIGLFLGLCPVMFFGSMGYLFDSILIVILSLLSAFGLHKTLR